MSKGRKLLGDRSVVMAAVIAIVSSAVLLAYRSANPDKGAEHYYSREHHHAYRVMQVCYVVILASIGFNMRFLFFEVIGATALSLAGAKLKAGGKLGRLGKLGKLGRRMFPASGT